MKLLIADIRKEQHLQETIALLEFILNRRSEIPDFSIQVQRDIKDHSLVLPNLCVKGVDDIWEFIRKYTDPITQEQPASRKLKPNMNITTPAVRDDPEDLQSYQKQMLASGDETKEVPLAQQVQQQQRATMNKGAPVKNTKPAQQVSNTAYTDDNQDMDIQAEMTRILKQSGEI